MLKFIRKKGVIKKLIWAVAILIIISFGFLGTAYLFNSPTQQKYAGKIFGEKVTFQEFESAVRDVNLQALIQYGDQYYDIRNQLDLTSQAWDRLILLHEADKRKISVPNDEVIAAIEQYNFFRRNGTFDHNLYKNIVSSVFKTTPRRFEENMRDTLKLAKMFDYETTGLDIPEDEALKAFTRENEKVQVSYATIKPSAFTGQVSTPEEELKSFFDANKVKFIMPESINVAYVELAFPEGATDEQKDTVMEKGYELFDMTIAADSLDGLDLPIKETGFFSKENPNLSLRWPLENLNEFFTLQEGEIIGPFQNADAVFIAQLKEFKDAYLPEFDQIKDKVVKTVTEIKSKDIARKESEKILNQLKEALAQTHLKDFPKTAKTLGLEIGQTPVFQRGQYLPQIGISPDFEEAAFELSDSNPLSEPVETSGAFYILYFDQYIPVDEKIFAEQKDALKQQLLAQEKNDVIIDFISKLRIKANLEDMSSLTQ